MENIQENAGLALIEEISRRARKDQKFYDILKELSRLSKEKVDKLIIKGSPNRRGKDNILHLVSYPKILTLESLRGDEFQSEDCLTALETKYGLKLSKVSKERWAQREAVMPTKKIHIRVDKTFGRGTVMDAFQSLPGNWAHKCLTWNQFISFLKKYPNWVNREGLTHFLIKKDAGKEVDENKPEDNLIEIHLSAHMKAKSISAFIYFNEINDKTDYPYERIVISPSRLEAYLIEDSRRLKPSCICPGIPLESYK